MGFSGLRMWEIILIFLVFLLLFGAKRLPEIGSSLGKGIREFKGSVRDIERELKTPQQPKMVTPSPAESSEEGGEPRKLGSRTEAGAEAGTTA